MVTNGILCHGVHLRVTKKENPSLTKESPEEPL